MPPDLLEISPLAERVTRVAAIFLQSCQSEESRAECEGFGFSDSESDLGRKLASLQRRYADLAAIGRQFGRWPTAKDVLKEVVNG